MEISETDGRAAPRRGARDRNEAADHRTAGHAASRHTRPTSKLFGAISDRHVEIMRDDLSEIYYDAARDDVEYLFGDSITAIVDDGDGARSRTRRRSSSTS